MKTKETLYTTMCNNIGQVRIENAQKEIERLNRQYNTNSWRTDNSPFMFVEDETDEHVHNPCELIEGYVWVTCEPLSTREQISMEKQADLIESEFYKPNQKQYSQEEVDRLLDQQAARTTAQVLRSNQKQFKQFDESLFLAYIDKFNDNDKLRAFRILYKEVIKHYVIDSEIEHNKALGLHE